MGTAIMLFKKQEVVNTVNSGAVVIQKPIALEVSETFREFVRHAGFAKTLQQTQRQVSEWDFENLKSDLISLFLNLEDDERKQAGRIFNPYNFKRGSVNIFV